jgi:uncharacterized HhH-GPD family protein
LEYVMTQVRLTLDDDADLLLSQDPFALLLGMLLDQQMPMERAFLGPYKLAERLGQSPLDPGAIAAWDPEDFARICTTPPAVHRYPRSMAARIQALGAAVVQDYDGDTSSLWATASTGEQVRSRLEALPGFGSAKAAIFTALLGKQLGVRPSGWQEASAPYGESGSFRSVADVVDEESLRKVRETKQAAKAAKAAAREGS